MVLNKIRNGIDRVAYGPLEKAFRRVQRRQLSRGATLELIPPFSDRGGGLGTTSYGEWCYTLGLFQAFLFDNLPQRPIRMLDVGCGVGRLYLAVKPYLQAGDTYTGIDIDPAFIDICRRRYRDQNANFILVEASNAYYAKHLQDQKVEWPVEDETFNLITALSVWTHLKEDDWIFYLHQVTKKLTREGSAVISFFILDELYEQSLPKRTSRVSDYYPQPQNKWIFDTPAYGSENWLYPGWANVPEVAIGVRKPQFDQAVRDAGLEVVRYLPGSWKEQPGFFFQDVAVLKKRLQG